jgi:hypothetical protein
MPSGLLELDVIDLPELVGFTGVSSGRNCMAIHGSPDQRRPTLMARRRKAHLAVSGI